MTTPSDAPHVLFIFLDGIGLGPADPATNPLATLDLPSFQFLTGGRQWTDSAAPIHRPDHVFHGIDSTLGVEGLPQSGTGQATLFTGINCAALAGRHFGPYPHSASRPALAGHSIFRQVRDRFADDSEPAVFANAYPPRFFTLAEARDRWTVTTRACLDAGVRLRSTADLAAGEALTAELTGRAWREQLGLPVDVITEADAGRRLVALAMRHRFTLFEYFLTDKAGHSRDPERAARVLRSLDRFLGAVLEHADPGRMLLVVTSDHGNIEDLSTKSHTMHPVPLVAFGRGAEAFAGATDLTEVTPAVMDVLTG